MEKNRRREPSPPTILNERRNILIFTVHKLCIRIGTISG
jgi:hypothetical protein